MGEIEIQTEMLVDHPEYTRPTKILTRSDRETYDTEALRIGSRSQPDPGDIGSRSRLSCNDMVESYEHLIGKGR